MQFESAKCPNCGAEIKVPDDRIRAICMFCGSQLNIKEAQQKYRIEISGNMSVSGVSTVDNDIQKARQCVAINDYHKAFEFYCQALSNQSDNFEAWQGCLSAVTHSLTYVDTSITPLDGYMGLSSILYNCLLYAPQAKKEDVKIDIKKIKGLFTDYAIGEARPIRNSYKHELVIKGKTLRKWGIILIIVGISVIPLLWVLSIILSIIGIMLIISGQKAVNQNVDIETFLSADHLRFIDYLDNLSK